MIRQYYVEDQSLQQIAAKKKKSVESIRHILVASMRCLRRPENRWTLCLGKDYEEAMQELRKAREQYDAAYRMRCKEITELGKREIDEIRKETQEVTKKTEQLTQMSEESLRRLQNTTLAALGLSTRSQNALIQYFARNNMDANAASIVTLRGKIGAVNGIGRKSVDEIISVMMDRFGIDMCI